MVPDKKEYATIQIGKDVKEQIVEHCNKNDLKIGRFIERLFVDHMKTTPLAQI